MTRILLLFVVALAIVALLSRKSSLRRALWVICAVLVTYAILKTTGVIEAIAPGARWGILIPICKPLISREKYVASR